jgi:hypothetical protein
VRTRSIYESIATHGCSRFFFSTSSVPYVKSNGGITVAVVKTGGEKQNSSISLTEQSSIPSISVANGHKRPDYEFDQFSPSNIRTSESSSVESFHESKTQIQPTMPAVVIMPAAPPGTVPPHFPEMTRSTLRAHPGYDAV